jgi:Tol biopolymer transport system component
MTRKNLIIWALFVLPCITNARPPASTGPADSPPPAKAAYLGQTPPGDTAIVFAPGFISTKNAFVQNSAFSPDGKHFYFTITNATWDYFEIMHTEFRNGKWTIPAQADFFKDNPKPAHTMEPFFAPDGRRIYFSAGDAGNLDIWYCRKRGDGWEKPVKLPETVNTSDLEWYPTISRKNTLFFPKNGEIFHSRSRNGQFDHFATVAKPVNSIDQKAGDPYISPNEDYLIFHSIGRPGGFGQGDLYISFKKKNGAWTNPKNLGPMINTEEFEFSPSVTPDGKYILFSRRKQWLTNTPSSLYWIKSDVISLLRHTNFIPYSNEAIPEQPCAVGRAFAFAIPDAAFIDDDGDNTLTWSAQLASGDPLPAWLRFDPVTRTFSGTPTQAGAMRVKIAVTDPAGAAASATFTLTAAPADESPTKRDAGKAALRIQGAYFGQRLPGETPVLFAPEILNSVSTWVEATDFSPDGTRFLLAVGDATYSSAKLYYSKQVNDLWTPFAEPSFIADFTFSHEPHFSTNGITLTFTGKKADGTLDLWTVSYSDQGWGTPVPLPAPINSGAKEYRGSTMSDGTVYFGSDRSGMMQLYKGRRDETGALVAERMDAPINTNSYEGDPCIAPDGHFLVFYSARDKKSADLYVSFRDENGAWGPPVNLGEKFNSPGDEYGAHLSADGKYLFFTRHTAQGNSIYWVAASAIEKFKP